MPYFNMASLYLADESGYFGGEGMRIEIRELDRSQIALPLLAGGQADAAFFGISAPLINAVVRGARVRIVAGRHVYSPECIEGRRLYGSRQAFPNGFTDLQQMRGKKASLGRSSSGLSAFIWAQCLVAAGLTDKDVSLLNTNDKEASATLLATGKIDVLLPAQELDIGLTSLRDRIVPGPPVSAFLPNFVYAYIIFGKRFLDAPPAEGARFLKAYFRGSRDFLAGKTPKFVDRIVEKDGLDAKTVHEMCRNGLLVDGQIQLGDLQRFIDWSAGQQLAPTGVTAEQLVDRRFLSEAHLA
jgi:NitT/TauT family transport system substrate-binding protein